MYQNAYQPDRFLASSNAAETLYFFCRMVFAFGLSVRIEFGFQALVIVAPGRFEVLMGPCPNIVYFAPGTGFFDDMVFAAIENQFDMPERLARGIGFKIGRFDNGGPE